MGIKNLLRHLPGGRADDQRKKFSTLTSLSNRKTPVDIDCGSLIYSCVLHNTDAYLDGNLLPAAKEFYRRAIYIMHILKWDAVFVMDGSSPEEKKHEHERRRARHNGMSISSTMTAMCAKVCQQHLIPFVVSPQEADMQVRRQRCQAVVLSSDGDAIAYGAPYVVLVDRFGSETFRTIDMSLPVTIDIQRKYPLYACTKRFGIKIIHWWAAVNGCDVSANKSGIDGVGSGTFLKVAKHLCTSASSDVSAMQMATFLLQYGSAEARSKHTVDAIVEDLEFVSNWYCNGGCYYSEGGNIVSFDGSIRQRAVRSTTEHMRGRLDPKEKAPFTAQQNQQINEVIPHNMFHSSAEDKSNIRGVVLPEGRASVDDCLKAEVKKMLISRGASVMGKDGKELGVDDLRARLKRFLFVEKERPSQTVYFNRTDSNGIFSKIDTGHKQSIERILRNLARSHAHTNSGLVEFFSEVESLHTNGRFIDDFDTIAAESPEIDPNTICEEFIHIGHEKRSKSIRNALKRVVEMNDLLYHAVAWREDRRSFFILSKQQASQRHDQKTRTMTGAGERPLRQEYLVMMEMQVQPTDKEKDGHTLGVFVRVRRSYCALCTAGYGLCYHRGMALWTQYNHWGEGRPTPKPTTISACPWIPGSRGERSCKVTEEATNLMIEKLPDFPEEYDGLEDNTRRKRNMHYGHSARYDVYGGNAEKRAQLSDPAYVSPDRTKLLFQCLRDAQMNVEE